ncbi:hypothetical protein FOL47_008200 [Perkinsus chesapeaki]|uniref:Uncharacterized protein n=1 Tax=Perkinsus chesapeaki TaxID=330153 RepID=A0A7J6LFV2_PERCH|nr:hypothetical protein FOL47_008200 [Perkinsus chesapeaki]
MPNSSNLNRLLSMVVLLAVLWSIECQTGSYSGYTKKKQQCIQVNWIHKPKQVMAVGLTIHCGDSLVGSPELEVIKIHPNYPYTVSKVSKKDRADFMRMAYDICKLDYLRQYWNDMNTYYYDEGYTKIRVNFHDEVVNLTRGECPELVKNRM